MIQRIQSFYLLDSIILIGLLFSLPLAEMAKDGAVYLFTSQGILLNGAIKENAYFILGLIFLSLATHIYAILNFKNRKKQVKVIVAAIVMLLVLFGLFFLKIFTSVPGAVISYKIGLAFPLIAVIFDYLAILGIKKDEALIRSIDRIR